MAVVQSETALVVLSGEVSRRLIGRAVAALPQVQARKQAGRMVVVGGSTTRHVAEALTGEDPGLASFTVGWIRDGALGESPTQGRGPGPLLFDNGEVSRGWPGPLLERFEAGDIYITRKAQGAGAPSADHRTRTGTAAQPTDEVLRSAPRR